MALSAMTTPLWCLLGFVTWTLVLLVAIAIARVSQVLAGRAKPTDFPAGVPHGSDPYWRLNRAHLNCLENLPLFASVVLIATVAGLRSPALDTLARIYIGARVCQSLAHLSSGGALAVNVRFGFFFLQFICLVGFVLTIVRSV
jgi:uncharacterized MAPEG superfamily protein